MKKLNLKEVTKYVENNIGAFHTKRLLSLERLSLHEVLQRKNPYLFKAKNMLTAQDLVKNVLDAFLQSQEETMFGDFLEGIAIFICGKIFGGVKSKLTGIDLEFERDKIKYIVEIKSGVIEGEIAAVDCNKLIHLLQSPSLPSYTISIASGTIVIFSFSIISTTFFLFASSFLSSIIFISFCFLATSTTFSNQEVRYSV